jgi:hypothetical protein
MKRHGNLRDHIFRAMIHSGYLMNICPRWLLLQEPPQCDSITSLVDGIESGSQKGGNLWHL